MAAEARIPKQEPKGLQTNVPTANVGVAVDSAAERLLTVVQMESSEPGDADKAIECRHRRLILFLRPKRIAGSEDVASVEADSQSI